jgi:hypothetical protein
MLSLVFVSGSLFIGGPMFARLDSETSLENQVDKMDPVEMACTGYSGYRRRIALTEGSRTATVGILQMGSENGDVGNFLHRVISDE